MFQRAMPTPEINRYDTSSGKLSAQATAAADRAITVTPHSITLFLPRRRMSTPAGTSATRLPIPWAPITMPTMLYEASNESAKRGRMGRVKALLKVTIAAGTKMEISTVRSDGFRVFSAEAELSGHPDLTQATG